MKGIILFFLILCIFFSSISNAVNIEEKKPIITGISQVNQDIPFKSDKNTGGLLIKSYAVLMFVLVSLVIILFFVKKIILKKQNLIFYKEKNVKLIERGRLFGDKFYYLLSVNNKNIFIVENKNGISSIELSGETQV